MISFSSLLIVGAVAVAVPLFLGLVPAVKVPAVVLEILGGILVGPTVLGWVHLDVAVRVIADLGLGFLLFMAGFEIDLRRFDRRILVLVSRAFLLSMMLALLVAYGLQLGGQVRDGLLVGITLVSTSLGVLVPILHDAGQTETIFGRMIMAAGSLAELAPLVLLSVFFSASSKNPGAELGLLAGFVGLTAVIVVVTQRVRVWGPLREVVHRLENTSSQLRVRLAITFALAFSAVAEHFGLATILGAFLAGVIVRRTDETPASQEEFQGKLEAIGFGFLIPVFFVTSGMAIDTAAMASEPVVLAVFVVLILGVRGGIVFVSERLHARRATSSGSGREAVSVALYAATGLPIIVAVTSTAVSAGEMSTTNASVLVAGGAITVLVFPLLATLLLGRREDDPTNEAADS